jgi:uncharacterized protein with GYD domain
MPHYVLLVNWTEQGIRNVKGTVERTDDVAKLAEKHGGGWCSPTGPWVPTTSSP